MLELKENQGVQSLGLEVRFQGDVSISSKTPTSAVFISQFSTLPLHLDRFLASAMSSEGSAYPEKTLLKPRGSLGEKLLETPALCTGDCHDESEVESLPSTVQKLSGRTGFHVLLIPLCVFSIMHFTFVWIYYGWIY